MRIAIYGFLLFFSSLVLAQPGETDNDIVFLIDPFDIQFIQSDASEQKILLGNYEIKNENLKYCKTVFVETVCIIRLNQMVQEAQKKKKKLLFNVTKLQKKNEKRYINDETNLREVWSISNENIEPEYMTYTVKAFKRKYSYADGCFCTNYLWKFSSYDRYAYEAASNSEWQAVLDEILTLPNDAEIQVAKYISWSQGGFSTVPLELIFILEKNSNQEAEDTNKIDIPTVKEVSKTSKFHF